MAETFDDAWAPDFAMQDVRGQTVRLSDYRGIKHVVLVFNRGMTCPFCRRHMVQLHREYPKFIQRDAEIVVVAPDSRAALESYWEREQIPFVGLPDPDHIVADRYGQEVNLLKLGRMPALFVLDKKGRLRYQHYGNSMTDIPRNSEILGLLDELQRE